jgi:hypothetical protein
VSGRVARPSESVAALARLGGVRVPFEIGMSLVLGFDATVISAVDLSRPLELVVTGQPGQSAVTLALVPRAEQALRGALSSRFRLVAVPGLGERLELLGASPPPDGWRCALVRVAGPASTRMVCANAEDALTRNARWVAQQSLRPSETTDDVALEIEGAPARAALGPYLRRALSQGAALLGQSEDDARSPSEPSRAFADPSATGAIAPRLRAFADEVDPMLADLRRLSVRLAVASDGVRVDVTAGLDPAGRSALVRESARRVEASRAHPLASRLPPDAPLALASRSTADGTRTIARALAARALLDPLARGPDAQGVVTAATADLEALFEHAGDAVALSFARTAPTARPSVAGARRELESSRNDSSSAPTSPLEATVLLAQDDGGASARASLRRLAAAPWLRGRQDLSVTASRDALTLRPAPSGGERSARRAGRGSAGAVAGASTGGREVTLAVSRGALALLWGRETRGQLRALDGRVEGAVPAAVEGAEAPMVLSVDVLSLARGQPGAPLRLSWRAAREEGGLRSTVRLEFGGPLLRAVRGLFSRR